MVIDDNTYGSTYIYILYQFRLLYDNTQNRFLIDRWMWSRAVTVDVDESEERIRIYIGTGDTPRADMEDGIIIVTLHSGSAVRWLADWTVFQAQPYADWLTGSVSWASCTLIGWLDVYPGSAVRWLADWMCILGQLYADWLTGPVSWASCTLIGWLDVYPGSAVRWLAEWIVIS